MEHKVVILYLLFINKVQLKSDAKERTILETWSSEKNLDYKAVVDK